MVNIENFFSQTYYFIERVPLLNSTTNLVDLFQKCIVLPFLDKNRIASSHYYTHIDEKNFSKCFLLSLPVPVILTLVIGLSVLIEKTKENIRHKSEGLEVKLDNISTNDISRLFIHGGCLESWPCQHESYIDLKNGARGYLSDSYQICSIVHAVQEETTSIEEGGMSLGDAREHFKDYDQPWMGWEPQTAQQVLDTLNEKGDFHIPQRLSWWEKFVQKNFGCHSRRSPNMQVIRPKNFHSQ